MTEKIKGIVFSENDVNDALKQQLQQDLQSGYQIKSVSGPMYQKAISDFTKGKLALQVNASGTLLPIIDAENLRRGIIGKTENEMRTFLAGYSEIDKVEIKFSPAWLSRVPVTENKIDVDIKE